MRRRRTESGKVILMKIIRNFIFVVPAAKDNPTLPHPCHFRNRPQGGVRRGGSTNSGSTASSWDGLARDWPFWPTYLRFAHTFAHDRLLCIPSACALADSLTCWRSSLTDCSLPPPPHPLHAPAPSTGLENDGMDLHTHTQSNTYATSCSRPNDGC